MVMAERNMTTNGVELHILQEGDGPVVALCHGFPELAFSWRHQSGLWRMRAFGWWRPTCVASGSSAPRTIERTT